MKFKKIITLAMTLVLTGAMVACGNKNTVEDKGQESLSNEKTVLRLGVMGSIDAVPLVIAQENGYFEEEGIDLDLQIFKAAKDRDAALQAEELDGVLCDEVAISIYQNSGIDMKITGTTNGFWTLVAGKDSGINSVDDLKGKKIAISERTMIDYLADYIATENGMESTDIEKVAIPAMPARLEALKNNQIDAAILPAPFNDTAVADGGIEITKIYNKDIMISVTAFLQDIIDSKPEAIKGFYKAYNKAIEFMNYNDIAEYEDIVISTVGYAEEMRGNIILPELKTNYLPATENVQKVLDWSKNTGIITTDLKAEDVISDVGIK
ncbi:ABC transporter substrate-binding protein [Clostridium celatum]|uniref:NLPA lipoprotein n=1 Tax=Clostridium celatum DSM 1785 TaxID=545697 RepID=L1Q6M0_9CLOT|nr:MetQ/NlpA family ABC transporter substrate-binding protein [Clostridium celatum]EKY23252.1 NLPA lipoprotein [Clostridium celatum DSM 1785]MCE9655999.1 MetQ/NlpA family ABC transporter substrate-binding protein [Clostridium celatum]